MVDYREKIGLETHVTRGLNAMKTWSIVIGVLVLLFLLGFAARHPKALGQEWAKVFPHYGE
jgi:hypothetical protein